MMLMCGQSNPVWHFWAGIHPGKVGVLVGPSYHRKLKMRPWMPCAFDNDAWISHTSKKSWNAELWREMLQWGRMTGQPPKWVLIPDVVQNRDETLRRWDIYAPEVAAIGWPLAFAVQDGMSPLDVPLGADVIFVGGSDAFKYQTLPMWTEHFPRVHVGRVNEVYRLEICQRLGVESVDGSGWFRDTRRLSELENWMQGNRVAHPELAL